MQTNFVIEGTLGRYDMWNRSTNLAALDCTLQNQLEQGGKSLTSVFCNGRIQIVSLPC